MLARFLPLATPFDSAEDPPGSIDPLGTVAGAEQLADVLFSGMTARMWRARHLTFAALAAHVADQAAGGTGTEDLRLEARLSLERLFVSAVARQERNDNQWKPASRRLPGIGLARRALAMGDQPLTKRTFLKGQAINGPFGVVSRLARNLKVIDDDNRLDRNGEALLIAWAKDQDLPGIFDGCPSNGAGTTWLNQLARQVVQDRCEWWPSGGWGGWEKLAQCLRPDRVGPRERKLIRTLLTDPCEPLRRRCVELLQCPVTLDAYRQPIVNDGRGRRDREVLFSAFRRLLQPASSPVDRTIYFVTDLIDAYEQVASNLEFVMRVLCSALAHNGGRAGKASILTDRSFEPDLGAVRTALHGATRQLQSRLIELSEHPEIHEKLDAERIRQLLEDAQAGFANENELVERVLDRHARVQRQKKKGVWVEADERYWTLMPGFGNTQDDFRDDGAYIHPFRVANAYSFLADLKMVPAVETSDAEES